MDVGWALHHGLVKVQGGGGVRVQVDGLGEYLGTGEVASVSERGRLGRPSEHDRVVAV